MYVAPDGTVHYLYQLNGRDAGTADRPVRYSKDGSFLRLRRTGANQVQVELPDGRPALGAGLRAG